MLVSKLIPLVVMAGVGVHSKDSIKERIEKFMSTGHTMVTKQRMMTIASTATLVLVRDETINLRTNSDFLRFVRRSVKLKNKGDPTKDMWGTTFRYNFRRGKLTLVSAGQDKKFGSSDDLKLTEDLYDY